MMNNESSLFNITTQFLVNGVRCTQLHFMKELKKRVAMVTCKHFENKKEIYESKGIPFVIELEQRKFFNTFLESIICSLLHGVTEHCENVSFRIKMFEEDKILSKYLLGDL